MALCRWFGHKWGRWRTVRIGYHENGKLIGVVSGQARTCDRCGKEEVEDL